jgi:ribulose 1,5-bisphosphate synthetase/thiazole synthase
MSEAPEYPSFKPVSSMPAKELGSYPNSGIDVVIVGTGLAGLTCAIECIRKGHNVKVLERGSDINTAG